MSHVRGGGHVRFQSDWHGAFAFEFALVAVPPLRKHTVGQRERRLRPLSVVRLPDTRGEACAYVWWLAEPRSLLVRPATLTDGSQGIVTIVQSEVFHRWLWWTIFWANDVREE